MKVNSLEYLERILISMLSLSACITDIRRLYCYTILIIRNLSLDAKGEIRFEVKMSFINLAKSRVILIIGILDLLISACNTPLSSIQTPAKSSTVSPEGVISNPQPTQSMVGTPLSNKLTPPANDISGNPSLVTNTPLSGTPTSVDKTTIEQIVLQPRDFEISYWTLPQNFIENSCLEIENSRLGQAISDEVNLYFSVMNERNQLIKMSLDFTVKSVIYSSKYDRGFLNTFPMQLSQDWLLFMDTDNPTGSVLGSWELIALNLNSGKPISVTDNDKSQTSLLNFYATISGDTVYWTKNIVDESNKLIQKSSIHSYHLVEEIENVVYEESSLGHVDTILRTSNNYLVIERDPNSDRAPETIDIALFNLKTKVISAIPFKSPGSWPQIQFPFMIWKNNYRFDDPVSFTYYDMETNQQFIVPFIGVPNSDLFLYDRYPYARTMDNINNKLAMTFTIYDVLNRKVFVLDPGSDNMGVGYTAVKKDYLILNMIPDVTGSGDQTTWLCKMATPFSK